MATIQAFMTGFARTEASRFAAVTLIIGVNFCGYIKKSAFPH